MGLLRCTQEFNYKGPTRNLGKVVSGRYQGEIHATMLESICPSYERSAMRNTALYWNILPRIRPSTTEWWKGCLLVTHALAMLIAVGWTKELQAKLWAEATKTAALLGNMLPNTRSTVPSDEQFYGRKSELYSHLIEFGRVGYVTNRNTMKGKLKKKRPQWS